MSPDRKKRPLRLGEWFPVEIQASGSLQDIDRFSQPPARIARLKFVHLSE